MSNASIGSRDSIFFLLFFFVGNLFILFLLQVPRIFINGQCVGGNSDLKSLDQSGKLKDLLQKDNS